MAHRYSSSTKKRGPRLEPAAREAIVEALRAGSRVVAVAHKFGVSPTMVRYLNRTRLGHKPDPRYARAAKRAWRLRKIKVGGPPAMEACACLSYEAAAGTNDCTCGHSLDEHPRRLDCVGEVAVPAAAVSA